MKKLVLITVVALGLGSAAYAHRGDCEFRGQDRGAENFMHHKHRYGNKMHRFHRGHPLLALIRKNAKELKLTSDQRQKIRVIMWEKRKQMLELKDPRKTQKPQFNLSAFMNKDSFNEKAFQNELSKLQAARAEANSEKREKRVAIMAQTFKKIFDVLTPEQREKLIQLSK